jgi:hypothetical protein
LGLWSEPDAAARLGGLSEVCASDVVFHDMWSCTTGVEDLSMHVAASQIHMPGTRLERDGELRHCQGTALVDWIALGPDAKPRGRGTNVFEFGAGGRIERVVGFWKG